MPKIKIIRAYYKEYYDDDVSSTFNTEDLTEWTEVSYEELEQLRDYRVRDKILTHLRNGYNTYRERLLVFEELTADEVKLKINSVKELLSEIQKKESAQKKKDELAAKKRKEAHRLKQIERAKKLLEESGEL